MKSLCEQIAELGRKHGAKKIVLFGSRARGDYRENSDLDLAIYGMPESKRGTFWAEVDELPTILQIDLVYISDHTSSALLENIEKDGITLMDKFGEKHEKLKKACQRLAEGIQVYHNLGGILCGTA